MRNASGKILGKIKTHILCSVNFLSENRAVCEIILENIVVAEQATDGNMVHVHCVIDDYSYKNTLRTYNT
jgi:hypothetical protein